MTKKKIIGKTISFLKKWILRLLIFFFVSTIFATACYRFVPVYITPLMVIRCAEQAFAGDKLILHHNWTPLDNISRHLPQAVIASEDNRFMEHNGIDFEAIKQAKKENRYRRSPRGASTISQQTAKNVFLWPKSSWLRKGFEVYFTFLIENIWNKRRIMEVYVNSIEMGKGIYGAEAVAKYNFNTTASKLSRSQCALIAATLPNPRRFNSARPSNYIIGRQHKIMSLMNMLEQYDFNKKK